MERSTPSSLESSEIFPCQRGPAPPNRPHRYSSILAVRIRVHFLASYLMRRGSWRRARPAMMLQSGTESHRVMPTQINIGGTTQECLHAAFLFVENYASFF